MAGRSSAKASSSRLAKVFRTKRPSSTPHLRMLDRLRVDGPPRPGCRNPASPDPAASGRRGPMRARAGFGEGWRRRGP